MSETGYTQVRTVKVARPDTPEGYMIINASDYRADLPQWMYAEGHAYDPAVYPPYVEPVLKAPPKEPEAPKAVPPEAPSGSMSHPSAHGRGRSEDKA